MEKITKLIGASILTMCGFFFLPILGTLFGAFSGWAVGLFFSEAILAIADQLGIHSAAMWQLGAFGGFAGGFLRTKVFAEVRERE